VPQVRGRSLAANLGFKNPEFKHVVILSAVRRQPNVVEGPRLCGTPRTSASLPPRRRSWIPSNGVGFSAGGLPHLSRFSKGGKHRRRDLIESTSLCGSSTRAACQGLRSVPPAHRKPRWVGQPQSWVTSRRRRRVGQPPGRRNVPSVPGFPRFSPVCPPVFPHWRERTTKVDCGVRDTSHHHP
jgi:hypothetical protein